MSLKAAIQSAVQTALYNDKKIYDSAQVMNAVPYGYETTQLIRDLLLDVAHELAGDQPPVILNVDAMDLNQCMSSTVNDLQASIYITISLSQ